MNLYFIAAGAVLLIILAVLGTQLWNKRKPGTVTADASALLGKVESAGKSAVGAVESLFAKHPFAPVAAMAAAAVAPSIVAAPIAPVTSSDPVAAAHAALDTIIADAQKTMDAAKAKKDALTQAVTDAVAAAK